MSANIPHSARQLSSASLFGRVSALFLCAIVAALAFSSAAFAGAAPALTQPVDSTSYNSIPLTFVIPEAAAVDTVLLTFSGAQTRVLTLHEPQPNEPVVSTINPAVPTMSDAVKSIAGGPSIPDGTYTVTLSYQDTALNPATSDTAVEITTDTSTEPPSINAPTTGSTVVGQFSLDFNLPESPLAGSIHLDLNGEQDYELTMVDVSPGTHVLSFDPADVLASGNVTGLTGGTSIAYGVYDISVEFRDSLGNPSSSSSVVTGVRIDPPAPPSTPAPDAPAAVVSNLTGATALSSASRAAARARAARSVCLEMDRGARRTRCLARAKPTSPSFAFTTTGAGTVTLAFVANVRGYLVGGKCLARKRRSMVATRRCMVKVAELTLTTTVDAAGTHQLQLAFAEWRKLFVGATTLTATMGESTSSVAFRVR